MRVETPLDEDYDIDVGVMFDVGICDHEPLEVKRWVFDAVEGHTSNVKWRRPCITVFYQKAGEPVFHVDLAVYARDRCGQSHIAMGKQHSADGHTGWERSEPQELTQRVGSRFDGEDAAQFRRVVRYLKRWKDVNFPNQGNAAPTGIALTVCGYHWFQPMKASFFSSDYDDLKATQCFVDAMLSRLSGLWGLGLGRLEARLPVAPQNDLFESMTDQQMQEFKQRLEVLRRTLVHARGIGTYAPAEACELLQGVFGSGFPA